MSDIVGIDIGSYSVRVASVDGGGNQPKLSAMGSVYNPTGQFLPDQELQVNQLAGEIKKLLGEHKLSGKAAVLALPEAEAFTTIVNMPLLTDAELSSAAQWEAEQHLPVALNDVHLEYEVLSRPKKGSGDNKMRVLMVAAKKVTVEKVLHMMDKAGVEVVAVETVNLAVGRALANHPWFASESTLICHFGALSVDMQVVQSGEMMLFHSIPTAGLALTRALEKGLGLDPSQAEEYKRTYGLDERQLEGKVRAALMPVLSSVVAEMRKTVQYYQSEWTGGLPVKRIVVSGGGAYLPHLVNSLAKVLSLEVSIANPFDTVKLSSHMSIPNDAAAYTAALGLAKKTV